MGIISSQRNEEGLSSENLPQESPSDDFVQLLKRHARDTWRVLWGTGALQLYGCEILLFGLVGESLLMHICLSSGTAAGIHKGGRGEIDGIAPRVGSSLEDVDNLAIEITVGWDTCRDDGDGRLHSGPECRPGEIV